MIRLVIFAAAAALGAAAYLTRGTVAQPLCGIGCLITLTVACSERLRGLDAGVWRTVVCGLLLQIGLALFAFRTFEGQLALEAGSRAVGYILRASDEAKSGLFGDLGGGVLAVTLAVPVIFVAAVSRLLYHTGVLQVAVGLFGWVSHKVMGTGWPESFSAAANVLLGQTEAPAVIRPWLPSMSRSALLAVMAGGLATVSGALIAVYSDLGADRKALLTTSLMAAPAALYLSRLLVPPEEDAGEPADRGGFFVKLFRPMRQWLAGRPDPDAPEAERTRNVYDALARGAQDGLFLALNVVAVLIVFVALVKLINLGLGGIHSAWSLEAALAAAFKPLAYLIGLSGDDARSAGELLGVKLALNEFFAFERIADAGLSDYGLTVTTFALNGFANFGSVGVLIGGLGYLVGGRRSVLASLAWRALLAGFVATLINACIASVMLRLG